MTKKLLNPELPKGVFANKCGTYRARSHRSGKNHYLGTFKTIEEAAAAYKEFELKYPPASHPNIPEIIHPTVRKNSAYDNLRAAWNNIQL